MATWTIKRVETYDTYDGHEDVIFRVHWRCTQSTEVEQTDDATGEVTTKLDSYHVEGGQGIEPKTSASADDPPDRFPFESFTPYESVTEEEVLGWLHTYMGPGVVTEIEERCTRIMQASLEPPTASGTPWA